MDVDRILCHLDERVLDALYMRFTKAEKIEALAAIFEQDPGRLSEELTDTHEDDCSVTDAEQRRREYEAMLL